MCTFGRLTAGNCSLSCGAWGGMRFMYQRINSICTANVNTTPISTDAITVSSNILICYHTTVQCLLLVTEIMFHFQLTGLCFIALKHVLFTGHLLTQPKQGYVTSGFSEAMSYTKFFLNFLLLSKAQLCQRIIIVNNKRNTVASARGSD